MTVNTEAVHRACSSRHWDKQTTAWQENLRDFQQDSICSQIIEPTKELVINHYHARFLSREQRRFGRPRGRTTSFEKGHQQASFLHGRGVYTPFQTPCERMHRARLPVSLFWVCLSVFGWLLFEPMQQPVCWIRSKHGGIANCIITHYSFLIYF